MDKNLQMIEKKDDNIFVKLFKKLKSIFVVKILRKDINVNLRNNDKVETDVSKTGSNQLDMVVFDLDGTLWSSDETTYKSVNEYLKLNNYDLEVSFETVKETMGCTFDDTAAKFFPGLEKEERNDLLDKALAYNNKNILKLGGNVYSNVEETLKKLKEKYRLTIVSNCAGGYIEAFLEFSNLGKYFDDFIAAAEAKVTKADAIKMIIERNNVETAIYVGDTDKDKMAAEGADIEFIQALYGFGENLNAAHSINEFTDLPEMLENISF